MFKLKDFQSALHGDDSKLVRDAGPGGIVRVAPELASVLVVQGGSAAKKLRLGVLRDADGGEVHTIPVPRGFRVSDVAVDGDHFVLTAADGRTVRGTPDQLTADPKLLDPEHNPRHKEQVEELFLTMHQRPVREQETVLDPPVVDIGLSEPHVATIARLGEVLVPFRDDHVWVGFDCAGPEKIVELLPHARGLLASLEQLGREAAEYLQNEPAETLEEEDLGEEYDEDEESLDPWTPTGLLIYLTGDFELHFEGFNGTVYMDGYWTSVQFTADRTLVCNTIEG